MKHGKKQEIGRYTKNNEGTGGKRIDLDRNVYQRITKGHMGKHIDLDWKVYQTMAKETWEKAVV